MNILVSIAATSTISVLSLSLLKRKGFWTSVWCGTSSDLIASLCGSCLSVQTPQSGLLQCMGHPKPPCHLLSFRARPAPTNRGPQCLRDFPPEQIHSGRSPFGTLNFMSYIHHSRHTHHAKLNALYLASSIKSVNSIL